MRTLALVLAASVLACAAPQAAAPAAHEQRVRPGHAQRRAQIDRAVTQAERRVAKTRSWMLHAELAAALLARADLDGRYEDYARVEAELDAAFALAGPGLGPHLLRARFELRMHRVDAGVRSLQALTQQAELDAETDMARRGLLADVAVGAGRLDEAQAAITALLQARRSPADLARQAHLLHLREDDAAADALYAEAISKADDGETQAWLELQRGLLDLDAERYDDAAAHYQAADAMFPDWWLVHEHLAEVDALRGHTDAAIERYREVVADNRDPELLDALARLLEPRDPQAAAQLHDEARASFEARLARFPEASYGHAFEHFFAAPDGAARALALAQANAVVRPGPDAQALLARARARPR
ncbi:MAG: hypothetical protein K1X88_01080 [Nannocystaceae bacterium]|nr:hypothetical protein [Nannocystaceae bacterium]